MMNPPFIRQPPPFDLTGLEAIIGVPAMRRLRAFARKVEKKFHGGKEAARVWHINSSAVGGGVADILNCLVPLSNEVGISAQWWVIGGDEAFFEITKTFHNAMQGNADARVRKEMFAHYDAVMKHNGVLLRRLFKDQGGRSPDVIVVHDPQPAGLVPFFRGEFPDSLVIWRGHIQFDFEDRRGSHPGLRVWRFLIDYINQCDGAIFHLPELRPPGVEIPIRYILPSINPLALMNRDLSGSDAEPFIRSTLCKYGFGHLHDPSIPLLLQNARFDSWKDPSGVIEAVRSARTRLLDSGKLPQLVLAGPLAEDDPEAQKILAQLGQMLDGDGAVHLVPISPKEKTLTPEQTEALVRLGLDPGLLNAEDVMELEINALQTRADVIIAKSLREGFGLAATGAGYHGKPRIISQIGGLARQVAGGNGDILAAPVGGTPVFTRKASIDMTRDWIIKLLASPALRRTMGKNAKRHVIRNFLPHRHLADYFKLFLELWDSRAAANHSRVVSMAPSVGEAPPAG